MAIVIGATFYPAYGTLVGLAEYAAGSLSFYAVYAAAVSTDTDAPARALVEASRFLALQAWLDPLDADPDTAQPLVVQAAYELALAALADASIFDTTSTASRTKRLKAGEVEIEYTAGIEGSRFPSRVMELIAALIESTDLAIGVGGGVIVAGVSCESAFDDEDRYGLVGPG